MVDETKLLAQLQAREYRSIDRAIDLYTPYLSTVLYNTVGNALPKEDLEEILSDVFVALWTHADRIDLSKGTLRSYLAAIAKNRARETLRKRREILSLEEVNAADSADFTQFFDSGDLLWNAVMELGEPDNEIFVRYYKYNEKLREIAKATGLNLSTVKTKLSRGKRKLKSLLQDAEVM